MLHYVVMSCKHEIHLHKYVSHFSRTASEVGLFTWVSPRHRSNGLFCDTNTAMMSPGEGGFFFPPASLWPDRTHAYCMQTEPHTQDKHK